MARSQGVGNLRAEHLRGGLEVKIDDDGQLQVKCRPMFVRELRKILREIDQTARGLVRTRHHVTGKLERSIKPTGVRKIHPHRIAGSVTAGSSRAPYARFVHDGARAHVIRARKPGGRLSFTVKHGSKNGSTTYTRDVLRPLRAHHMENMPTSWAEAARKRRAERISYAEIHGKPMRRRISDADLYTDTETHSYAGRKVVVAEVNHPGYRGDRFLNEAAAIVVGGRGGRVNLPKRRVTVG
jgi:hypothetical protein